jgi:cytochrome c-type biogenesis protein CcmH/NrfF
MRVRLRLLLALTLLITVGGAGSALAAKVNSQELLSLEGQYECISCHEPLDQVNSPQAISEKQELASLLRRGLNTTQVRKAMVNQYGVGVLTKPPAHGLNLTVYILPPAVFVAGVLLLIYMLPRWRARARRNAGNDPPKVDALNSEDSDRLDDELAKFI